MRIGYGFKRSDRDFAAWDCERVFIDTPATLREARRDLFLCLQPGDTLFMFKRGDLGHGKELSALRKILEDHRVKVEYAPEAPDRRGRPKKFDPSPENDKYIRTLWKDQTVSHSYVERVASERTGVSVKRHQLKHRYGTRGKSKSQKDI